MTHVQSVTTSYWVYLQSGSRIKVLLSGFTAATLVLGHHRLSTAQLWTPLTWHFASTWLLTCYSGVEWSCSNESQTMWYLGWLPMAPRVKVRLYNDLQDPTWCDKWPLFQTSYHPLLIPHSSVTLKDVSFSFPRASQVYLWLVTDSVGQGGCYQLRKSCLWYFWLVMHL